LPRGFLGTVSLAGGLGGAAVRFATIDDVYGEGADEVFRDSVDGVDGHGFAGGVATDFGMGPQEIDGFRESGGGLRESAGATPPTMPQRNGTAPSDRLAHISHSPPSQPSE